MNRCTMHPARWLAGLILALLALAPIHPAQADYDADAEIQRLIEHARASKTEAAAGRAKTEALRNQLKQAFLQINNSQREVSQILYQVRVMDARNKALLTVKTGMLFKMVYDGATGSVLSTLVDIGVTAGSDYLQNHYPKLFDTTLTKTLPTLSDNSLVAIKKFQWILSLSDDEIAGMIRNETPELAKDRGIQDVITGGKLSDDLIALYRAKLIITKGTETENALQALKSMLAQKQNEAEEVIQSIDRDIKGLDEAIHDWERTRDLNNRMNGIPPPPPTPPVTVDWQAKSDFPTAAANMREALKQLQANQVDCWGYSSLVQQSQNAAWNQRQALWQEMVAKPCMGNWGSDECMRTRARFEATVAKDYETQIGGTEQWLKTQFDQEAAKVGRFGRKLAEIKQQTFTVGDFGYKKTREYHIGEEVNGQALATALFWNQLALPPSYFEIYYGLPKGAPPMRERIGGQLEEFTKLLADLEFDLDLANRARSDADAAAHDIDTLVSDWEPNLRFWGCWGYGTDLYQRMRTFKIQYDAVITTSNQNAQRTTQAARQQLAKLNSLSSAYGAEDNLIRLLNEAGEISGKLWQLQGQNGYQLNDPRIAYVLWSQMGQAGVTAAMIAELAETVPKLGIEKFAVEYALGLNASQDPRRKPVLDADQVRKLRGELLRSANSIVPVFNEYHSLYGRLNALQQSLDSGYASLRRNVESIQGEPAPWLDAPMVLNKQYLMNPNDFPDPSAGVFEQLDQYAELAARYHTIMDKLAPWTFPFLADMDKLRERLDREKSKGMGLSESEFSPWLNGFSREATDLAFKASQGYKKHAPPDSPFGKALGGFWNRIAEIGAEYNSAKRIAELTRELQQVANGVGKFLARPDFEGGPSGANNWINDLGRILASDSEARKYQGNSGIASLLNTLSGYQARLRNYLESGGDAAVRKLYQDFASTYQARNLSGLLRYMTEDWKASDGSDLRDLEDVLGNSFRVFDRIQFAISGLAIRPAGQGRYGVSYTATITGHLDQMNLKHQESAQVEDIVVLTQDGPKIQATRGGRLWLQQ
ncbi:MAG: hypothetical protein PHD37_08635 [Gallionellaceae bacterium]|nr:hypothetical protein [Gallionellaceae bacterium]